MVRIRSVRRFAVWIFALGSGCATSGSDAAVEVRTAEALLRSREEGVIAVLREFSVPPGEYVFFETVPQPFAAASRRVAENLTLTRPAFRPSTMLICGFSVNGNFVNDERRRVKALFGAFGLRPDEQVAVPDVGDGCILDVFDSSARLGVKFRGPASMPDTTCTFVHVPPSAVELDDAEAATLRDRGVRLFVREASITDDGDFNSKMAFVADVVAFLNATVPGPGVDVSSLLRNAPAVAHLRRIDDRSESAAPARSDEDVSIDVDEDAEVRFRCDGLPDSRDDAPGRNLRALAFNCSMVPGEPKAARPPSPAPTKRPMTDEQRSRYLSMFLRAPFWIRVEQRSSAGPTSTWTRLRGGWLPLPSSFDPSRPFDVVFGVYPGRWTVRASFHVW